MRRLPMTASLHAVSTFLSLSPSLQEACIRDQNAVFCPHVQLKALDVCLSMSLDQLPTSQSCVEEPTISNSLMSAIKRSQARGNSLIVLSVITVENENPHLFQGLDQLGLPSSGLGVLM